MIIIFDDLKKAGERKIKGILLSRLIVITMIILVPIVSFILFSGTMTFTFLEFTFNNLWVPDSWKNTILIAAPWFFSIGWLFILILFANRIAGSLDEVDINSQVVPQRLKIFFGIQAIILIIIFGFPLLTPAICILSFASFGFNLTTFRKDWNLDEKTPKIALIMSIIFAIFPAVISFAVLPDMFQFSQFIWNNFWRPYIDPFYKFTMALCTTLTIGSLIILFKTGVSEYEQAKNLNNSDLNLNWVYVFEFILILFLLFLEWKKIEFIQVFYVAGFLIACFVTLINYLRGRKELKISNYLIGYLLTVILLGINLLQEMGLMGIEVKNISIIVSASVYIFIYFIVFLRYEDT
ncbi:MAG: hypothetical protein ACTSWY_12590 [Promethearchaeota archaeon]